MNSADGGLAAHAMSEARVAGRERTGELCPTAGPWCGRPKPTTRYLPQLVLAVVVPDHRVATLTEDVLAAVIVAFTVLLIPVVFQRSWSGGSVRLAS